MYPDSDLAELSTRHSAQPAAGPKPATDSLQRALASTTIPAFNIQNGTLAPLFSPTKLTDPLTPYLHNRPISSARSRSSSASRPSTSAPATRTRRVGSGRPTSTATPRPASSATPPSSATCPSLRTSPWPRCAPSSSARWSSPSGPRPRARTRSSPRCRPPRKGAPGLECYG